MAHCIDLHCHILPGLDDGPPSAAAAADLVHALAAIGVREFYPTPHHRAGAFTPTAADLAHAAAALAHARQARGDATAIVHPPAGESMWDDLFLARAAQGQHPCYPGEKAFLVELPPGFVPPLLREQLFQFRLKNQLPVLAHVERYAALTQDRPMLSALATSAALLVNLSSLGGGAGWSIKRTARRLVGEGLIHAVASDAHGLRDVHPCKKGLDWIAAALGTAKLKTLTEDAPRMILSGELP